MWRKINQFRPDVIHVHTPFGAGWASVAVSKLWGIPLVGTHHTFFDHYLKHVYLDYAAGKKFSWKYTVWFYNRCTMIVSPSKSLAADLIANGLLRPVEIVHNSVDTALFYPASSDEKKLLKQKFGIVGKSIVYMGRLSYEKDICDVLSVFAEVLKKDSTVTCMIVGDGPERENLETLATRLGIFDQIMFTGMLSGRELSDALRANDLFVTASKSENMPLSVIEAQASGLPVVAVGEKGLNEMVSNGVDGFLTPSGDILYMTEKVLKLLGNDSLRQEMSGQARLNAEKYSRDTIRDILEKIYEKVIADKKRGKTKTQK
jgi:glycosyltransferase involved in cell wall biosynthesis